jgi:ATP-binding cassette subfamily F protein uup
MIPYLQVEGLTRYWGEVALFEDLSFTIHQGQKVALIARNGAGKTTLLNSLMGTDMPDAGKITYTNGIKVGYLMQNPEMTHHFTVLEEVYHSTSEVVQAIRDYEQAIEGKEGTDLQMATEKMDRLSAWDFEVKIKQILSQLKINNFEQLVGELSGGQQKRVALANVLINEPDLLILDEPTNHLDLDMIEWLEEYLQKMNSTLFMVTHDRYFLDRVCNEILEIDNKTIYRYRGNYSYFLEKRAERIEIRQAEVEKARNLMRTALEWMRRMPKARGTKAKYRIDSFYELKEKASQRLNQEQVQLNFMATRLGKKVVDIYNLCKKFDELVVLNDFTYKFTPGEKVGIVGPNGSGKSTLLNLITGALKADSGRLEIGETVKFGYYRQDGIQFNPDDKVIDAVREIAEVVDLGSGQKWSASQLLTHFLFPYELQHARIEKLSGGEKRRLYLCTILMQNPNFLILDEPTNDLDIITLNVLEDYLQRYTGCVLIVSHDRYFMDKIVDHVFSFEKDGFVKDFPGNYSIYRQYKDEKDQEEKNQAPIEKKEKQREKPKADSARKLTFKEKREMEQLEQEIAALETERDEIEQLLNSGSNDHETLTEKANRYQDVKDLLDEKELRWLELSEI